MFYLVSMAFFSEFNNSYQGTVIALKRLYSVLCFEEENNEGTDKSNHGMGIGLIEETALKYNGLMEITMNENIFCLSVLLYQN